MNEWRKLRAIVSGFKNFHFPSEIFESFAKDRAQICAKCPEADANHKFKKLLEDQSTVEINGLGCRVCNCLLSAKVRQVFEGCPLGKWN